MRSKTTSLHSSKKHLAILVLFVLTYQFSWAQKDSSHFVTTWNTSYPGPSHTITIRIDTNYYYNYDVDWNNDGIFEDTAITGNISSHRYSSNQATIRIRGTFPRILIGEEPNQIYRNSQCKRLLSVDQWGTTYWKDMSNAFSGCENMILLATDTPSLDSVKDMSNMFYNAKLFNGNISNWDVSNVTNMQGLFHNAELFNQFIGNWDVSNVSNMKNMFRNTYYNQNIGNWDVSSVKNMESMFNSAFNFNKAVGNWNVDSVTNMKEMFKNANSFNQQIGNWNVSNVLNMEEMFHNAVAFNQPIGNWNVQSVTSMKSMFFNVSSFDQNIVNWNVSNVVNMRAMFTNAVSFNQNINNWSVSNVIDMHGMFKNAQTFNHPLDKWDVSNVTDMYAMFARAKRFNQSLDDWDISQVSIMLGFFDSTSLSTLNYDSTLIAWQALPHQNGINFGARGLRYCNADSIRNLMITNSNWHFSGDSRNCNIVGIEKKQNTSSDLRIYPNPTKGELTIEHISLARNTPLIIYNSIGEKVRSVSLENQNQKVDLNEFADGVYFIVYGKQHQKVILKK